MARVACTRRPAAARAPGRRPHRERDRCRPRAQRRAAPADARRHAGRDERPDRFRERLVILAIDAGNSRVKWGWYERGDRGGGWSGIANVSLIEFAASSDHINPFSATHDNPERIIISNVAG